MIDKPFRSISTPSLSSSWRSLIITCSIAVGGVAFGYRSGYFDKAPIPIKSMAAEEERVRQLSPLFERYKIEPLPAQIGGDPQTAAFLRALQAEPCDQMAVAQLARALELAGRRRDEVSVLVAFADSCPNSESNRAFAAEVLYSLADYAATLAIAERLVHSQPHDAVSFHLLARALAGLRRFDEALDAYSVMFRVSGDIDRLAAQLFVNMASAYAALNRECESATLVQMFVAGDPAKREDAALRSMITDYVNEGRCLPDYAKGEDNFKRISRDNMQGIVEVEGVKGRFRLDTSLPFVVLSRDFARRAKIVLREDPVSRRPSLATAGKITFGKVSAVKVPVVVLDDTPAGVDGVIGRSLLARFEIESIDKNLRLKAKTIVP